MKLTRLYLRHAIGIYKGIGLHEIDIDLSRLSGVIGIVGKIGTGKTTIMENMIPYRSMVSRENFIDHFYSTYYCPKCDIHYWEQKLKCPACNSKTERIDAMRILEFEYNEDHYKSEILIDTFSRSTTATLYKNGSPLNNKNSQYDKIIEEMFGSFLTFQKSIFSGQRSELITEMKPSDLKKLFIDFMGITKYDKVYIPANEQKLNHIMGRNETLIETIDSLKREIQVKETIESEIDHLTNNVLPEIESKIEILNDDLDALIGSDSDIQRIRDEVNNLGKDVDRMYKEVGEIKRRYQVEIDNAKQHIENANEFKRVAKIDIENIKRAIWTSEKKIDALQGDIKVKITSIKDIEKKKKRFYELKERYPEYEQNVNELHELRTKYLTTKNDIKRLNDNLLTLNNELKRENERLKTADTVPCRSIKEINSSCELLANVTRSDRRNEIKEKIKQIKSEIDSLNNTLAKLEDRGNELKSKIASFPKDEFDELSNTNWGAIEVELEEKRKNIENIKESIKNLRLSLESKEESLNKAEEVIRENQEKILLLENEMNNALKELNAKLSDKLKELNVKKDELSRLETEKKAHIDQLRYEIKLANDDKTTAIAKLSHLKERLAEVKNKERKIEELKESSSDIVQQIEARKIISKALKQIQVMKLEAIAPNVMNIANDLLEKMFDSSFSVKIETVLPKKRGNGFKESFTITVFRDGEKVDAKNLSGGQSVIVDRCIREAMRIANKNYVGRNIQCGFCDESDGSLDEYHAQLYLDMLNLVYEKGDFKQLFVVTHRESLKRRLESVIELSDGKVEVKTV